MWVLLLRRGATPLSPAPRRRSIQNATPPSIQREAGVTIEARLNPNWNVMPLERNRVAALQASWSLKTSEQWLATNPARGQCNVTALLINELFGGQILKTPLPEGDHFYNHIDGQRIDLTDVQFDAPINYLDIESDRSEALAGTSASKYAALKAAFSEQSQSLMSGRSGEPERHVNRPPVLAHERFVADHVNFAGLGLGARFERIAQTNLWGAATSASGLGSESAAAAAVREALPNLLQRLGVRSLLDAPCGDAGWINDCIQDVDYTGVDVVSLLIAENTLRAERGEIAGRFLTADITHDSLPGADLILCRDCLVHLSFENIHRAVARFRASGAQWLLTTTFPEWEVNLDCEDGDWRALNLQQAPFSWPAPAELINERCDEGNGGWRDKSLGLWRLADLPDRSKTQNDRDGFEPSERL